MLFRSQVRVGIRPTLYALSTLIFVTVFIILIVVNIISHKKEEKES